MHTNDDRQLMPFLNKKFAQQINNSRIDSVDIKLREIIHKEPLFNLAWFDNHGNPRSHEIIQLMAASLFKRCRQSGELSNKLFELVLKCKILNPETREGLQKLKLDTIGKSF